MRFWVARTKPRLVIEVEDNATLYDLHLAIHEKLPIGQIYYGRPEVGFVHEAPDDHLHTFEISTKEGVTTTFLDSRFDAESTPTRDITLQALRELGLPPGSRLRYEYDMGTTRRCELIVRP